MKSYMIGSLIKSALTRESLAKALPIAKKVLMSAGKIYAQGAARTAGEKTIDSFTKAPQKAEEYLNKKKSEFLEEAGSKAEQFFATQMEILDQRIDKKIIEIENKFDKKIRLVFWLFLVSAFAVMILAGFTFAFLFKYFNF